MFSLFLRYVKIQVLGIQKIKNLPVLQSYVFAKLGSFCIYSEMYTWYGPPPPLFWGGLQENDPISFQGAGKFWKKWGDLSALGGPLYLCDGWGLIYKYCDDFQQLTVILIP